jgi:hypothetical protein
MTFAISKGETSIKDLVSRLFGSSNTASQSKANDSVDALAAALLKANPQLSDIGKLPAGTLIIIPETAPPLRPAEQVTPTVSRRVAVTAQAQQSLASLNQKLTEIDTRAVDIAKSFLAMAQSLQTEGLAGQNPELTQQLPGLTAWLRDTVNQIPAVQEARSQDMAALVSRLQSFATS